MTWSLRGIVLAAMALVLAACGGESNSGSDALTAAEWRREANAICRDIGRQARAISRPTVETKILEFTAAVTPLWKLEEERIRALSPPQDLASSAEGLADTLAEVNVALLELHVATERNDSSRRAGAIERGERAARGVQDWSRTLRLTACGAQRIP